MAKRIAVSELNASTIDILNTIRANASYEYQSLVPEVTIEADIPKVGETLFGYPALANQFINALINRIAAVRVKSATFNNPYADLKKGYLEFGETVEEVFVNIAKAIEFSAEKAEAREFKRSFPDVRAAFHVMNWRVLYPVTIQNEDLKRAFLSIDGVQDLIARIVQSVYTAAAYDEYLLFKYLIIKAATSGMMKPVAVDTSDIRNAAIAFRGTSNKLGFMSREANAAHVLTTTPRDDQEIFMSAEFNAQFDVDVLASAFNMGRADFMGRLQLIDDWTTFDNDRFSQIMAGSDQIEEVTAGELALMQDVIAVLIDREWFQIYDNENQFTEKYVASGLYWNYFYHTWKTVSSSPFSNAVVFVNSSATIAAPASFTVEAVSRSSGDEGTAIALSVNLAAATLANMSVKFLQSEDATAAGIAVQPYGAVIIPEGTTDEVSIEIQLGDTTYVSGTEISAATAVGTTFTMTPAE